MEIEILYEESVFNKTRKPGEFPGFVDIKQFWKIKTKNYLVSKAVKEAVNEFYKWANKEKKGALILQITFLDFYH